MASVERVRLATPEDVLHVCARLRAADVAELAATGSTLDATRAALVARVACVDGPAVSEVWVGVVEYDDGRLDYLGLYGCHVQMSYGAPTVSVWALFTDAIARHRLFCARVSRAYIRDLVARFRGAVVGNVVDGRNRLAVRWVRWLGFALQGPFPTTSLVPGASGAPLHVFVYLSRENAEARCATQPL